MPILDFAHRQWQHWRLSDVEETLGHVAATTIDAIAPSLAKRDSTSTSGLSGNTPASTQNMQTVAIALGAGIPLGCAVVVLFLLHRRHLKRQKLEDLNDPHKSLDFGMNPHFGGGKKGRGGPEMSAKDLDPRNRRARGLSMDMGSPYILPRELNGSRASLHSMSRSLREENDPYRPVTMVKSDWDNGRARQPPYGNGSMYSAAGSLQSAMTNEKAGLVSHASPMSSVHPGRENSRSPNPVRPSMDVPGRQLKSAERKPLPARDERTASPEKSLPAVTPSRGVSIATTTLDDFVPPPPPPPPKDEPEPVRPPRTSSISAGSMKSVKRPARKDSIAKHPVPAVVEPFPDALPIISTTQAFDHETFNLPPPPPEPSWEEPHLAMPQPQNNRMSIIGMRPLPADLPDDNPEVRANRIRSFYKEYFDDSKPNPKGGYVDDYDADYLADYAIYDHAAGGFLTSNKPFAQPIQRRAMTPPPRAGAGGYGFGPGPAPHRRHMSTQSGGMYGPRGRAASAPKKRLPPPQALISLPTPHMLKDDSNLYSAAEFAPPTTFRDRQGGRTPDSPRGTPRPYSPMVPAHSPLVKSYDELAQVPSPYLLRKSGTFTSLDFAPPSRLRVDGTASDAGSIRSNRSGISAVQQHAIRGGAYRVSRIPTEMVTTKAALADQLKPRWDMRNGNNIMG